MAPPSSWFRIGLSGLVLAVLGGQLSWAQSAPARFELPSDPQALVLRFSESLAALAHPDPGPSLEVYADGRVAVHYPPYMKRAGDYELRLDPGALQRLVASQLARGVAEFDPEAVRSRRRELARERGRAAGSQRPELFSVPDAATSRFELRLGSYQPAGRGPQAPFSKRISWHGLAAHARHYPEIAALADLARARRDLLDLMQSADLVRVR
jgi:hypothetical protein